MLSFIYTEIKRFSSEGGVTDVTSPDILNCVLIDSGDHRYWETRSTITITYKKEGVEKVIVIEPGVITNFASVPIPFKWFIKNSRPSQCIPATVHDALVNEFNVKTQHDLTWDECCTIFRDLLKYMGECQCRIIFLVWGVKLWGLIAGK